MYLTKAHDQYRRTQVQATPERLVVMLFDGLVRFLRQGQQAIEAKDWEKQSDGFSKAQRILLELDRTLDVEAGGETALNLRQVYRYCIDRLTYANHQDDSEAVDEVLQHAVALRAAWAEAEKQLTQPAVAESAAGTAGNSKSSPRTSLIASA